MYTFSEQYRIELFYSMNGYQPEQKYIRFKIQTSFIP